MPYNRPGLMFLATATKAVVHGAACTELGIPGVAVKQALPPFGTGPAFSSPGVVNAALNTVQVGEQFSIITKGIVEVPVGGLTPAKGDAVYIIAASNALTATVGTNVKFGRVVEIAGQRGCRTGFVRIDLDHKATF